ncbi:hypothetical protein IHQ71_05065 [Rhizobium sp. TH2]|uniref:hypothetical protein n=1 Tax=Rhizobium sp. TH2 TaxID=2775403 RepID=UPI002157140A|nr:hypothetical protein [Rhizobium sp. TH2]UVC09983.1 hypothetical protein IHQ71_05065 [Rhizobium sp. TH2]
MRRSGLYARWPSPQRSRHRRALCRGDGDALIEISHQIVEISSQVDLIARSAREQSVSLQEVNASVDSMDQMTQRNAAMVEETSAATRQLAEEADMLMELVGRFRLGDGEAQTGFVRAA